MKILYVGRVPSWHKSAYGGEEHMEQIAVGMANKKEYDSVLFVNAAFDGLISDVQFKKLPYCYCPITHFILYPKPKELREAIKDFKPDIIHHFARFGYSTERLREKGVIGNIPTVNLAVASRERQDNAAILQLLSRGRLHSVLSLLLDRYTIKHSDIVVTPSEVGKRILLNAFENEKDKIRVIPRGINLDIFSPGDWANVEKGLVLCVGRLDAKKGLDYIIDAMCGVFNHVENARLIIAGDGPDKERLELKVSNWGVDNKITFLGKVPHDAIASEYKRCNVALFHSEYESFGASVAEAMASARPVVTANKGGVRDIVIHGENGYLVPFGHISGIEKAVISLLDDDIHAQTLGLKGRHRIEELFGLDSEIERFEKLYLEMIEDKDA